MSGQRDKERDAPTPDVTIEHAPEHDTTPDAQRFQRLGELFDEAVELDAAGRGAFIARIAATDDSLANDLSSLLAHDLPGGGALASGVHAPGAVALSKALTRPSPPSFAAGAPVFAGRFRLIRLLGEGGMARVFEAEQLMPRRRVALKLLRRELATERAIQRFRSEMEIMARLLHPGIAQVYEAAIDGDEPYIVMELVHGEPLTDYVNAKQPSLVKRVELLAALAEAVAFAHTQGVVHRDLKPGNILVEADGRPKVLDFGIARVLDDDTAPNHQLTQTGELVGTPAYMSPEQTMADPGRIGMRTDVYALGVIGYQVLTGQMPYPVEKTELFVIIAHVRKTIPTSAGRINRELRGDLEVILDKALEKEPDRRYDSAGTFAADLRRWLAHEPIHARPPSSWYQLARFARRNRVLVTMFGVLGLVLIAGVVASTSLYVSAERARDDLAHRHDELLIEHARDMLDADPAGAVLGLRALSDNAAWDRAWLIGWAAAGRGLAARVFVGHSDTTEWVDAAPEGTHVASASYDGSARVWDVATGASVKLVAEGQAINRVAFSADGRYVASGGRDGVLRLFTRDGVAKAAWPASAEGALEIEDLAFAPDGRTIAVATAKGVLVWRLPDGALPSSLAAAELTPPLPVEDVAWSDDGRWLGAACDGVIALWDIAAGETDADTHGDAGMQAIAFAPVEAGATQRVVSGDEDGGIVVRETNGAALASFEGHRLGIKGLVFVSRDLVAAADRAGSLRLHDVRADSSEVLRQSGSVFRALALSPDRRMLATASDDRTILLYDVGTRDLRILRGHRNAVEHVAFVGADRLVSSGAEGEVRLWEVPRRRTRWDGFDQWPRGVAASSSGDALAVVDAGGWVRRLDVAQGGGALIGVEDDFFEIAWSPLGDVFATANRTASELARRRLLDPSAPLASQGLGLPVDTDLLILLNAKDETEAIYGRSPLLASEIRSLATEARAGRLAELSTKEPADVLRLAARMVPDAAGYVVIVGLSATVDQDALMSNLDRRLDTFEKLRAARGPISSLYLSLFLFPALLTLVGASWLPFVLARRFARPVRNLALAAERIAAGERGVRVEKDETDEEFVKLIQSFNLMSERLARSEEEVEFSRADLTRKNVEIDERRRLMETVLETIGTGVIVVNGEQKVQRVNSAAARLLGGDPAKIVESPLGSLIPQEVAGDVSRSIARVLEGRSSHFERDVTLFGRRGRREVRLRAAPLASLGQGLAGAVMVLEDVTPLMQAQKVAAWGEVARKLAHEIKNPLTPIKLSAQRVRKAHLKAAPDFDRVLSESVEAIVSEVDALQHLVDEFAQFARLPPPRPVEGSLNAVVEAALALYGAAYPQVSLHRQLDPELPLLRLDGPQIKRVVINLVDNAIAAMNEKGSIEIGTSFDTAARRAMLTVADCGPGVPAASRESIFAPNFSTKRKGSGLGLAIARRIVEDHGGEIRVEENSPKGARFVIDLPF